MIDVVFENPLPDHRQLVLTGYSFIKLAGDTIYAITPAEGRDERTPGPNALVGPDEAGGYHIVPIEAPIEVALAVRNAAGEWQVNGFDGPTFAQVHLITHDYLDALVPRAKPLPT